MANMKVNRARTERRICTFKGDNQLKGQRISDDDGERLISEDLLENSSGCGAGSQAVANLSEENH